ncbi:MULTISPECIES: hypothetical protein [Bacillota]|nr:MULTISPECIES: hypothetical protein [Bacillota]
MNELRIPLVCRFQVNDMIIIVSITLIKQGNSPFILMQIEPLFN